jgi:hypothetical protein
MPERSNGAVSKTATIRPESYRPIPLRQDFCGFSSAAPRLYPGSYHHVPRSWVAIWVATATIAASHAFGYPLAMPHEPHPWMALEEIRRERREMARAAQGGVPEALTKPPVERRCLYCRGRLTNGTAVSRKNVPTARAAPAGAGDT